jgi:hypothetical protein
MIATSCMRSRSSSGVRAGPGCGPGCWGSRRGAPRADPGPGGGRATGDATGPFSTSGDARGPTSRVAAVPRAGREGSGRASGTARTSDCCLRVRPHEPLGRTDDSHAPSPPDAGRRAPGAVRVEVAADAGIGARNPTSSASSTSDVRRRGRADARTSRWQDPRPAGIAAQADPAVSATTPSGDVAITSPRHRPGRPPGGAERRSRSGAPSRATEPPGQTEVGPRRSRSSAGIREDQSPSSAAPSAASSSRTTRDTSEPP